MAIRIDKIYESNDQEMEVFLNEADTCSIEIRGEITQQIPVDSILIELTTEDVKSLIKDLQGILKQMK